MGAMLARLDTYLGPRYSPHTRRLWLAQATRFLSFAGPRGTYDRTEVVAYVDSLVLAGYSEKTIHTMLDGVRALLEVNEVPWPLTRRDLHLGLPQVDPLAPALAAAEVVALIRGVRGTPGVPRAVVALVSTFGLRSAELQPVLARGILGPSLTIPAGEDRASLAGGASLSIATAKGGRLRQHQLPPELQPILTGERITLPYRTAHHIFEQLMLAHVRPQRPGEGWHAVRRALITGLLDAGVSREDVHQWMGWRRGEGGIVSTYNHPEPARLDARIYRVHPFLGAWGSATLSAAVSP